MGSRPGLALVGLPGAGKSTVGRRLARRLQLEFADSDKVLELRLGCSIKSFFDTYGEAAFRDVEEQVIDELSRSHAGVLATGGGAVLRERNRIALREHMTVIYLRATPDDLMRRLRHDETRPLLQVPDPLGRLRELFALRDPLYRQVAHIVVETGQPSVTSLVNLIVKKLPRIYGSTQSSNGVSSA